MTLVPKPTNAIYATFICHFIAGSVHVCDHKCIFRHNNSRGHFRPSNLSLCPNNANMFSFFPGHSNRFDAAAAAVARAHLHAPAIAYMARLEKVEGLTGLVIIHVFSA